MVNVDLIGLAQREANIMTECKDCEKKLDNGKQQENKLKSTTLWLALIPLAFILVASTILLWFGKISSEQWVSISQWSAVLTGIYTGNRVLKAGLDVLRVHKK